MESRNPIDTAAGHGALPGASGMSAQASPVPSGEHPTQIPSAFAPPGAAGERHPLPRPEPVERIVRDLRPRARVLAIVSGKGGVGKTSLAVNMAIGLATAGRRVLLVDADLGLANVDLMLGQRPHGDLSHVLAGRMDLEQIVQEGPAGIQWIPGASHIPDVWQIEQVRREALLTGLTRLETQHDFVLLDAPAGIGRGVLHLARQADELLLVTTPEPPAMMDAYTLLKAVCATAADPIGPVRLIVNMVGHRREAERVHKRLGQVSKRFLGLEMGLLGHVFCDGHVSRAVQKREPLLLAYPHSQAAWCIKRLSGSVLDRPQASDGGRFAFFRRLANLFAAG